MVIPLWYNSFHIFVVALQKHLMILAQNWPKTAKSSWHCSFNIEKPYANSVVNNYMGGVIDIFGHRNGRDSYFF